MNKEKKKSGTDDEDYALIRKFVQEGDMSAFDSLVLKYQDNVFNLCFRMMGDYDDARDCAQDTFYKAYRSLKGFRFQSGFMTWIYRIAVNTCKNNLSLSHRRMINKSLDVEGMETEITSSGDTRRNSTRPDKLYEKKEMEALIQKAVSSLPEDLRSLVILKDMDDRTYEDIAEILDMKSGTVKSRLARARQILREQLRGMIGNEL